MTPNGDNGGDFLLAYRGAVERRVREQIERHQNINPNTDPRRIVEIQIQQERERLEHLIAGEETTAAQAGVYRVLLVEYLPDLERRLRGR